MSYPKPINDFLQYMTAIRGRSQGTAEQYGIDLTLFFKYTYSRRNGLSLEAEDLTVLNIESLDDSFASSIQKSEIIDFLFFAASGRQNNARTRARKLCSLRAFYRYKNGVTLEYPSNPTDNIDSPKIPKSLPKYLSSDESKELLSVVDEDPKRYNARNYCIVTFFLNCGMRLSELCGINLSDIDRNFETLRIRGKGSKERLIYLNSACQNALKDYLKVRDKTPDVGHKDALFLSSRHKRISRKMVQALVYDYLREAGLANRGLSVHKLRHTAATLMYQTGKVDIRVLKDILGHEQLNTTQIYTHLSDESIKKALENNPLSKEEATKITLKKEKDDEQT